MDDKLIGVLENPLDIGLKKENLEKYNRMLNHLIGKTKTEIANIISFSHADIFSFYSLICPTLADKKFDKFLDSLKITQCVKLKRYN